MVLCVTTENQRNVDLRLSIFRGIPAKHKWVSAAPLLEPLDLRSYLAEGWIEHVEVTGEKAIGAARGSTQIRQCMYEWAVDLAEQCQASQVRFSFMSGGSRLVYQGEEIDDHRPCYHSFASTLGIDVKVPLIFKLGSFTQRI